MFKQNLSASLQSKFFRFLNVFDVWDFVFSLWNLVARVRLQISANFLQSIPLILNQCRLSISAYLHTEQLEMSIVSEIYMRAVHRYSQLRLRIVSCQLRDELINLVHLSRTCLIRLLFFFLLIEIFKIALRVFLGLNIRLCCFHTRNENKFVAV
jgi:hypothetical protein